MSNKLASAERFSRFASLLLGSYALVGGLLSFTGWVANMPRLTDWRNSGISIQPNTTIAVMAAGAGLILLTLNYRRVATVLGVFLVFIGISVLFQYVSGVNLGIDSILLFDRNWGRVGVTAPGRMGPLAASSWTLIGVAMVFASNRTSLLKRRDLQPFVIALGLVTASISTLSIIGYLYRASVLYSLPSATVIALQTATFILAVSLGLVMSSAEHGPMRLITEDSSVGILTRRILPALIVLPILIGMLRLYGERAGLYDTAFGSAIRTVSEIVLFMILLGWTGSALSRQGKSRQETLAALRASQVQLETELSDSQLLQRMSAELIREDDIHELYEKIIHAAATIMRSPYASMQGMRSEEGSHDELILLASLGFDPQAIDFSAKVTVASHSCSGTALRLGQRVIVADVEECDFMAGTEDLTGYRRLGIRAVQSTPLTSRKGKLLGMLSTHWSEPHHPSDRDLRLLDILARQGADLLERWMLESQRADLLTREQEARQSAEKANALKDEFLATLSHELRNPLNVILGYSEIFMRMPEITENPQLRKMSDALRRNALSQSQLINDLLDLSRLQRDKVSLNLEPVLLSTIINNAVESVRPEATAKAIRISAAVPEELVFVDGDSLRLQQVTWNLLNNAVKFTPAGGAVKISLAIENHDALIAVEDTGLGIDHEFLPHVFEIFRQADPSNTRSQGGMGIGLALVHQLVQLHGGSVVADSEGLGKGASFTVRLPVSAVKELPKDVAGDASMLSLSDMGVLVIDDSEDTIDMVRQLLEINGAVVHTAKSGAEALVIAGQHEFDVILSDVSMPEMDGFDFLRRLRTLPAHRDVPVLAITGFGRPEDIERARQAGFFSHITKPLDLDKLATTLQSVPRKKHNHDGNSRTESHRQS